MLALINSNKGIDWQGFGKLTRRFLSDITQVITNPQADIQTTILVSAILLLFAAILGLIVWLVISSFTKKDQKVLDVLTAKHFGVSRREVWTTRVIFIFVLVISLNAVYYYESRPNVCARCHGGELVKNIGKSAHKGISCLSCHSRPGIDGSAAQFIDYMRWISKSFSSKKKKVYDAQVSNEACLRCHENITREVVSQWGVRMRHIDILEKGYLCVGCHNGVAHGKALTVNNVPTMDKCLVCHNNKLVSAKCDVCHTSKAKLSSRKSTEEIVKIDVFPMKNCRGCHPQTQESVCISCHGLELPHPDDWVGDSKNHALVAFTNKGLCKKCHQFKEGLAPVPHPMDGSYPSFQIFCNSCHDYPSVHGSEQRWLKYHGQAATGGSYPPNERCDDCHGAGNEGYCYSCHKSELCSYCHHDGRTAKSVSSP